MKDIVKKPTQEQIEIVYNFIANWIKSGKKVQMADSDDRYYIVDDDIRYVVSMSTFDKTKLFCISVSNHTLDTRIMIQACDVKDKSIIQYIENYVSVQQLQNGNGAELTDQEFFKLTKLEPDIALSRARKINHLKDKM